MSFFDERVGLPDLTVTLAIFLAAIGLPVVVIVACVRFAAPIGAQARPLDLAAQALVDPSLRASAIAALDDLEPGSWIYTRRLIAHLYLRLGDRQRALSYLERMYAVRDGGMLFVVHDRSLAELRNEPRYQALAQKLGITPPPPL